MTNPTFKPGDTEWYPDISLQKWLKINPSLKESSEGLTCSCGMSSIGLRPIVFGDYVGVTASSCSDCGANGASACTPRSAAGIAHWRSLILGVLAND